MAIKVGINGFGRIGRNVLRTSLNDPNLEFVAVNDLTDPKTLAHLLKYDSILGNLQNKISATADGITIDNKTIKVFKERDPGALPWESVGAQVVIESTGHFTDANDAKKQLRGPVKRPVDSLTTGAPTDSQGRAAGSFSLKTLITFPSTVMLSAPALILFGRLPRMESYFSRCASVLGSVRSLTATNSRFGSLSEVRKTLRPMRPKPLMPTLIAMVSPFL